MLSTRRCGGEHHVTSDRGKVIPQLGASFFTAGGLEIETNSAILEGFILTFLLTHPVVTHSRTKLAQQFLQFHPNCARAATAQYNKSKSFSVAHVSSKCFDKSRPVTLSC